MASGTRSLAAWRSGLLARAGSDVVPGVPDAPDVVALLQAANAGLRAENAELKAENAELRAQYAELAERVARLEQLISRNSGNSSMPPSTDDLPGKKPPPPRLRRSGGRRPGKQPGAPGACLAWRERPDETRDVFAEGTCACGRDLAGARDLGCGIHTRSRTSWAL